MKRLSAEKVSKADIIRELAEQCLELFYVYASTGQMCTPDWRRGRIPYCPTPEYVNMIINNSPVLSDHASSCSGLLAARTGGCSFVWRRSHFPMADEIQLGCDGRNQYHATRSGMLRVQMAHRQNVPRRYVHG